MVSKIELEKQFFKVLTPGFYFFQKSYNLLSGIPMNMGISTFFLFSTIVSPSYQVNACYIILSIIDILIVLRVFSIFLSDLHFIPYPRGSIWTKAEIFPVGIIEAMTYFVRLERLKDVFWMSKIWLDFRCDCATVFEDFKISHRFLKYEFWSPKNVLKTAIKRLQWDVHISL